MRIVYISIFLLLALNGHSQVSEVILENFNTHTLEWRSVNDGVMGGLSQGGIKQTKKNTGLYEGNVSLENNGGFSSIRAYVKDVDLEGKEKIKIRVKGDGKTYNLRLRNNNNFDGVSFAIKFDTEPGEWIEREFSIVNFEPTFRGRVLYNIGRLESRDIRQIAFLIADKQEGEFNLEIDWIKAY